VGEQGAAVRAAIVQCHHLAAVTAVEQHSLVEDGAAEQLAVDQLGVEGGHVPAVSEEHASVSGVRSTCFAQRNSVSTMIAPPRGKGDADGTANGESERSSARAGASRYPAAAGGGVAGRRAAIAHHRVSYSGCAHAVPGADGPHG